MKSYVKRLLACCLCLLFSLASLGATSQSTTLRTTVPSQISLNLCLTGRGRVRIGDKLLRKSDTLLLSYSPELKIQVYPESGSFVKEIFWNGLDVTGDLRNGSLTLTELGAENELQVTFQRAKPGGGGHTNARQGSDNPATGDLGILPAALVECGSAGGLLLLYACRKRQEAEYAHK